MMRRLVQIFLMVTAAALSYWGWIELNSLRGTPLFEYRYVILLCGAILLFSAAQSIASWIDARINQEDH